MTLGKKDKRIQISKKELRINLEKLQSDVENVYQTLKRMVPESITNKEIRGFGNASHIILPKEYAGKKATVIIREPNDK